ncbi:MAG: serine hydrolase [Fulvivirga sp.]|nr:serine hydrolase [Fulvivirga sp.]
MKLILRILIIISPAALLLLAYLPACQSTYVGRYIAWNNSDISDHEKFPKRALIKSEDPFIYPERHYEIEAFSYTANGRHKAMPPAQFLEETNTTALIVIKNDSIYYEGYGSGYERGSINTSFSIAKSVTALLIGIALDQGLIESIEDPMIKYLPELKSNDPQGSVTIRHLLMMQSGFYYIDHDLPWGDKPKNYYKPNLRERAYNVQITETPGTEWQYMGYNPILCGMILEKVTHQSVTAFFEEEVWKPMGAEYAGSWSLDSKASQMEKMESGINGRAIDFVKIASLYLHHGHWNDRDIVSSDWVQACTSLDGSVKAWEGTHYKNFWWLYPSSDTLPFAYAATGHLGQYLFISPEERTVIARFGKNKGDLDSWIAFFRNLSYQMEENHAVNLTAKNDD